MHAELHPRNYYRLPWSLNDNVLAWLEPTKACNLYCEGCYSANEPQSHKSIEQVRADLEAIVRQRNVDSISIAGGDPLVHPRIVDIVRMVRHDFGKKPVVNTNGLALTPELLHELKEAGAHGFTFHVDSSQRRPGWKGRSERELDELRLRLARMVAAEGGLTTAFNATIFRHTLHEVPHLVQWAADHADIVHSMVFILFRTARSQEFRYFAKGRPVDVKERIYYDQDRNPEPLVAADVVEAIRSEHPDYEPAAYLGGTKDPNSFKWLLASRLVRPARGDRPGETVAWMGPRSMELIQTAHHAVKGTWLGYSDPELLRHGRSTLTAGALLDPGLREGLARWARQVARHPRLAADRLHAQTILIIQPIDMMPDGEMNMCDGCPDMTVHNGELVWSCRLDERLEHGVFYTAAPIEDAPDEA